MIEVIVDGKTARKRLFDTYSKGMTVFTPKNKEIREYCEFLKKYYGNYGGYTKLNYLKGIFVIKIDESYEKTEDYSVIADDESFLFEFPDDYPEEELFYFVMKYC